MASAAEKDLGQRRRTSDVVRQVVQALGGVKYLAIECDVTSWTVRAWMAGTRLPSPASQRRITLIARDFGLTGEKSGRHRKISRPHKKTT